MSADKRRKSRIQGGWAAQAKTAVAERQRYPPPSNNGRDNSSNTARQPQSSFTAGGKSAPSNSVIPTDHPLESSSSSGTDSGVHSLPTKFTFQPDATTGKKEPLNRIIDVAGSYIISTEPSGVSRIQLLHNFIEQSECDWIFEQLSNEVPWKQQPVTKAGLTYLQPRLTAWFGEHPYAYSGISHELNLNWTPTTEMLKDRIEEVTGFTFNSVLANLYRDGHDHVPWHSDDEYSLGDKPIIASLSFGDTRNFELRKKPPPDFKEPEDCDYPEYIKIPLDAGSLLIMEGCVQNDWQHRVPREYHDRQPRLNLTYRTILPA